MKAIEEFKNKIGRWQLGRELHQHIAKRKLIPFVQVNHIGLVYDADEPNHEQIVFDYANHLRAEGKKVFLLGYVNEKELPAARKFVLNSEFFWKEKLNTWNLPDKGKVGQFLTIEFDLLLNVFQQPVLPLQAISVYSKAKYKVGALMLDGGLNDYDFMVDIQPRTELKFLIEQMDFYLRAIT
jgi:hypothetical protein